MNFTEHAYARLCARRISEWMISLVLKYGNVVYNAGVKFVFMRKKDIPGDLPPQVTEKIEGIVVVLSPKNDSIITVYKNKNGLKDLKRKLKRNIKKML